ncbi:MAG: amphi-Trp domain-containing protein [Spirochaetia bacterium]|nr:amphi-Trp domain-containing protein [Spirochaetia bacterium]
MGKKEVSVKTDLDSKQAVAMIEELAAGLKKGKIYLQKGEEYVELDMSPVVSLEIEAVQKKHKGRVSIEIEWDKDNGSGHDEDEQLKILASEPEVEKTGQKQVK